MLIYYSSISLPKTKGETVGGGRFEETAKLHIGEKYYPSLSLPLSSMREIVICKTIPVFISTSPNYSFPRYNYMTVNIFMSFLPHLPLILNLH
jgi:hypothetical protein